LCSASVYSLCAITMSCCVCEGSLQGHQAHRSAGTAQHYEHANQVVCPSHRHPACPTPCSKVHLCCSNTPDAFADAGYSPRCAQTPSFSFSQTSGSLPGAVLSAFLPHFIHTNQLADQAQTATFHLYQPIG
jgi:hypothetical protein